MSYEEDFEDYQFFEELDYDDEGGFSDEEDEYFADDYDPADYGTNENRGAFSEDKFHFRSPRDVILARMHGILGNTEYTNFNNEIKNKAINMIESIPEKKITLYSIDVLVPVSLYMSQYKNQLSKNNVVDFLNKTSGLKIIDHLDFIRYIRIIKKLEMDGVLT